MKTNVKMSIRQATVFLAVGLATSTALAAPIDWGIGAQNISGDSDVSTSGTLVDAFAFSTADSATATTVNGVTFAAYAVPADYNYQTSVTLGNYSLSENYGFVHSYDTLGWGSGAFNNLSSSYGRLLSAGASSTFYDTLSLTMTGLTIGNTYQFQWWDNNSSFASSDANGVTPGYSTAMAGNGEGDSVGLNANDGGNPGSLGQFAIGTFTADDTTQVIDFNGSSGYGGTDPLINAIQLRDITPVPEPSTWALLAVGLVFAGQKFYSRRGRNQFAQK
jgi:hypothetical protein